MPPTVSEPRDSSTEVLDESRTFFEGLEIGDEFLARWTVLFVPSAMDFDTGLAAFLGGARTPARGFADRT